VLFRSDVEEPLNLGSNELVTINELVDIIADVAGVDLNREYDLTKPQGVDGRNSDNTKIRGHFGWEPATSLREGMAATYDWIKRQMIEYRESDLVSVFAMP